MSASHGIPAGKKPAGTSGTSGAAGKSGSAGQTGRAGKSAPAVISGMKGPDGRCRCSWCCTGPEMERYHDAEWGVPLHDDALLFEYLAMESLQCGLSWACVLGKRSVLRACFADFEPERVARMGARDVARILKTPGMIRSERKIRAVIKNAARFGELARAGGTFSAWLWNFCGGSPIRYRGHDSGRLPVSNALSARLADVLKKAGFCYLGPVTVYAYLQSCGVINDHVASCFRYRELSGRDGEVLREPDGDVF